MSDVTRILSQIEPGVPSAAEQLLPLVYDELRKLAAARLAQEKPGQTLQATALVHEAYLRLVGNERGDQPWDNRGHFFAAAAEAMRRILIDQARQKESLRRGGDLQRHDVLHVEIVTPEPCADLLRLNDALERFAARDPQKAQLVKLRYFDDPRYFVTTEPPKHRGIIRQGSANDRTSVSAEEAVETAVRKTMPAPKLPTGKPVPTKLPIA